LSIKSLHLSIEIFYGCYLFETQKKEVINILHSFFSKIDVFSTHWFIIGVDFKQNLRCIL